MASTQPPRDVREITSVTIAGVEVPAHKIVCPECQVLDLDVSVDTSVPSRWVATCTRGHSWTFSPRDD